MVFAFYDSDLSAEDARDAVRAVNLFAEYVSKRVDTCFEVKYFFSQELLDEFIRRTTVHFIYLPVWYLIEKKDEYHLEPFVITLEDHKPVRQRVLIVRKDSAYNSLDDLKGKVLYTPTLGPKSLAYLKQVSFQGHIDPQTFFKEIKYARDPHSAILALLFRQTDATMVDQLNFNILKELNPQVNVQLKPIFQSAEEPQPPMAYFAGNARPEMVEMLKQELLQMHTNSFGQQVLLVFSVDGFAEAGWKNFEAVEKLIAPAPVQ